MGHISNWQKQAYIILFYFIIVIIITIIFDDRAQHKYPLGNYIGNHWVINKRNQKTLSFALLFFYLNYLPFSIILS